LNGILRVRPLFASLALGIRVEFKSLATVMPLRVASALVLVPLYATLIEWTRSIFFGCIFYTIILALGLFLGSPPIF